jgi:hypothetical protein
LGNPGGLLIILIWVIDLAFIDNLRRYRLNIALFGTNNGKIPFHYKDKMDTNIEEKLGRKALS